MPRPTTKQDCIAEANAQFAKLWALVDSMSEEKQNAVFSFEDRDKNMRDVLGHLHEWHKMMEGWHQIGTVEGGAPAVPGEGYTWRTLPELNQGLWEKIQPMALVEAKQLLKESHIRILALVENHTNEELFAKGVYKWTKTSTLGAYFVSCTSSHYEWAMKKLKKHVKS